MMGGAVSLTDVLDLVGLLLIVAAAAVLVATWTLPGALAVAGVGLLAVSALIDARRRADARGAS